VEEALLSHPAVREAAVAGVPDDVAGQRVTAWVVLSEAVTPHALLAHLVPLLPAYKRPQRIHVLGELPRNRLGKIQKKLLLEDGEGIKAR
jgi:fatty acid CoA ligase FadD36